MHRLPCNISLNKTVPARNVFRCSHALAIGLSQRQELSRGVRHSSDLGIRSNRPPDSGSRPQPKGKIQITDEDWEIRTGRAIYVLQQTLPEFFSCGLVTSMDKTTGTPRRPKSSMPVLNANPLDYQAYADNETEGIYSPKVGLSYTPPAALPPPFPTTLHIEGLPLYLASSVFVRHTLNALYSNLSLELRRVVVNTPTSSSPPVNPAENDAQETKPWSQKKPKKSREKNVLVGFSVTGDSRVSGARGEWQVNSTYFFSPDTGLIDKHIVDSIYPSPHQAVYESLRLSLGKVFGFGIENGAGARSNGAACGSGEGLSAGHKKGD